MDSPTKGDYFSSEQVAEGIWSISGPANDLMYLVKGNEKAMLVDTGMGIGDLSEEVRKITNLPLIVVNTHGHPDHAGGNSNFEEVWLHPSDVPIMQTMCSDEFRINDVKALMGVEHPNYQHLINGMVNHKPYRLWPIKPGQLFDLGNRQFEVVAIPGHTPGCIALLCSREKILFAGDSIVATPVWLYLKHSLPVHTYWEALQRVREREDEFETLFPGHHPLPLGRKHLSDLIACSEEIIHHPDIGEHTQTFAGEGLQWGHGSVSIIYDPKNVH